MPYIYIALRYCTLAISFSFFSFYSVDSQASDPTFNAESGIDYDIVYVRYNYDEDVDEETRSYIAVPQGEHPYVMTLGADLILLKPNGEEKILVNCTDDSGDTPVDFCSVMDPTISFDGKTVYYSYTTDKVSTHAGTTYSSWIYKINLEGDHTPIRLTFNDGFDSQLYAANTTSQHDQENTRGIRDMSPIPLADGRLLFTSNRAGLSALNPGTDAWKKGSVLQLYTMEDHEGELSNAKLAQIKALETGTLHLAQHPIQLKDGRILFSSWQDVATRFRYAMTSLFTVNPDGSNLQQFTEPHDHHKNVEHFVTQLPDEQVVTGSYYPSFDFGYGILLRYAINPEGPDFNAGNATFQTDRLDEEGEIITWRDYREFSRKNTENITPHTHGKDTPATEIEGIAQGKYSMPAITKNSGLLVSFSHGYVNHFSAACDKPTFYKCEDLKSGLYLIPDATTNQITNKNELVLIKDDPLYNEMWPKPVLSYQAMYGVDKPAILPSTLGHETIKTGQAIGLVGTSSMYNRQSSPNGNDTDADKLANADQGAPFQSSTSREIHRGDWTIQGTDAGVYQNADIYGVRIISTPAKPFTKVINKYSDERARWDNITPYLQDKRLERVVARYGSFHGERWEILGEFPLTNKETTDLQGNPDSSWVAKIPADTPFLIQTIDNKGMALNSELAWRGLKSGEVRTDCGGCHAHSIEPLDFSSTEASKNLASKEDITAKIMSEITGVNYTDSRIKNGVWDLTTSSTPLLSGAIDSPEVSFVDGSIIGVEFNRDVRPILNGKCITCHTAEGEANGLVFDGIAENDAYLKLKNTGKPEGGNYNFPQKSHYIRTSQARESLLTWVFWGERLDGRTNDTRTTDIDYTNEVHDAHLSLVISDEEKRTIARWIDLGSPINFPETNGMGYTDDNQLPIININVNTDNQVLTVGFMDAHSGIDWSSIKVNYAPVVVPSNIEMNIKEESASSSICETPKNLTASTSDRINGVNTYRLSMEMSTTYLIEVEVLDKWGNKNIASKKLKIE